MSTFKFLLLRFLLFFGLFVVISFITPSSTLGQVPQNKTLPSPYTSLYSQGKYQELSQTLWKNFEHLNRADMILLIQAHIKLSEPDKVIKIVNILTSKDPKDYEAYSYLGNAYFLKSLQLKAGEEWKKNRQSSIDSFKKSLEIKNSYLPPFYGLIQLYEVEKNIYELRQLYRDLITIDGEKYQWVIKLCEIDTNDAIYESALKYCAKAMQLKPMDPNGFVLYSKSLYGKGDTEPGKDQLKKTALKFKNSDFANIAYADLLFQEKNYQDAFKFYSSAIRINRQSYEAWIGYANSSFEIQKYSEALAGFSSACSLNKLALPMLRKSTNILRNASNLNWTSKFESASEKCSLRK